jgi:hypothetical protein
MATEAEVGVMLSKPRNAGSHQKLEEQETYYSLAHQENLISAHER